MVNCIGVRRRPLESFLLLSSLSISLGHSYSLFVFWPLIRLWHRKGCEWQRNCQEPTTQRTWPSLCHPFEWLFWRTKHHTQATNSRREWPRQPIFCNRSDRTEYQILSTHSPIHTKTLTKGQRRGPIHTTCKGASCVTLEKQRLPDWGCNWTEAKGQGVGNEWTEALFVLGKIKKKDTHRTAAALSLLVVIKRVWSNKIDMVRQARNERMTRFCHFCRGKTNKSRTYSVTAEMRVIEKDPVCSICCSCWINLFNWEREA